MKWLGWGYDDLQACPIDLIPIIAEMMEEDNRANEG